MDRTAKPPSADDDKFVLWPLLTALGALFLIGLLGPYSQPYLRFGGAVKLFILLVVAIEFSAGLICLALAMTFALVQMWRWAVSMLLLPVAIVITVLYPLLVFGPFVTLGEYLYRLARSGAMLYFIIFNLPMIVVPVAIVFWPRSTGLRGLTCVTLIVVVLTPIALFLEIEVDTYYHWLSLVPLAVVAIGWLLVIIITAILAALYRYRTLQGRTGARRRADG